MKKNKAKGGAPRKEMTADVKSFVRRVAFTTFLAFTLITFFYLLLTAFVIDYNAEFSYSFYTRYILGKLLCIFLFSLCLGFANRLPERKKGSRALLRLFRFLAALAAFAVTMILMFYTLFEGPEKLTVQGALLNLVLFLILYFVTLGVTALGRRLFRTEEKKPFKSILD